MGCTTSAQFAVLQTRLAVLEQVSTQRFAEFSSRVGEIADEIRMIRRNEDMLEGALPEELSSIHAASGGSTGSSLRGVTFSPKTKSFDGSYLMKIYRMHMHRRQRRAGGGDRCFADGARRFRVDNAETVDIISSAQEGTTTMDSGGEIVDSSPSNSV
jgi:hypothetical protein